MPDDILARELHDRVTRGDQLIPSEQAHLDAWYRQQDEAENTLLTFSLPETQKTVESLRSEVDRALSQLVSVTQRIQSIVEQNETLRRDLATLYERLAQTAPSQAA